MSKYSSVQLDLKKLKRQAHYLAKHTNISKGEALKQVAQENGFNSWQVLRQNVFNNSLSNADKIPYQKYDPVLHSPRQIIGIADNKEGGRSNFQIRISLLSLFDEKFDSTKDFREYFDREISRIISTSKSHVFIYLLLYLNQGYKYPVSDFDGFLDSLKLQYPKIINFNIRESDTPLSPCVADQYLSEINSLLDEVAGRFQ